FQHANLHAVTGLDYIRHRANALVRQFGNMHEPFQTRLELDKRSEIRGPRDRSLHSHVARVALLDGLPRVWAGLLAAEADALVGRIERDDDEPQSIAFLDDLAGVLDPLIAHLADGEQSFNAFLDFDECA